MTDTPMRERLARAMCATTPFPWSSAEKAMLLAVDAILSEMETPSEGTKSLMSDEFWENYQEVIQHIRDGGR